MTTWEIVPVIAASTLPPHLRWTLVAFAWCLNHKDHGDNVFPSIGRIATFTGRQRRAVQKDVRALIKLGWLTAVGHRPRGVVIYRIGQPSSGEHYRTQVGPVEHTSLADHGALQDAGPVHAGTPRRAPEDAGPVHSETPDPLQIPNGPEERTHTERARARESLVLLSAIAQDLHDAGGFMGPYLRAELERTNRQRQVPLPVTNETLERAVASVRSRALPRGSRQADFARTGSR